MADILEIERRPLVLDRRLELVRRGTAGPDVDEPAPPSRRAQLGLAAERGIDRERSGVGVESWSPFGANLPQGLELVRIERGKDRIRARRSVRVEVRRLRVDNITEPIVSVSSGARNRCSPPGVERDRGQTGGRPDE